MKSIIASILLITVLTSCVQSQSKNAAIKTGSTKPMAGEAVATFAEGCFWHSEIVFQSLVGVRDAVSGYSGGNDANPNYEEVCTGSTGHAEAVQVYYDKFLVQVHFQILLQVVFI